MPTFSEMLPTLRQDQSPATAMDDGTDDFDQAAILRALTASKTKTHKSEPQINQTRKTNNSPFALDQLPRKSPSNVIQYISDSQEETQGGSDSGAQQAERRAIPSELEKAVAEAKRQASEERDHAVEVARQMAEDAAEKQLTTEREKWANEVALKLSEQLDRVCAEIQERISNALTDALSPVIEDAFRARAVQRFSQSLDRMLGRAGSAKPITVKGPNELIEALRKIRGEDAGALRLVASDHAELVASLGDTTIATTTRTFAANLRAAVGSNNE
ncbi:MAG: hypothetical protein AAGB04_12215 [Pseudomonadota bacterium]